MSHLASNTKQYIGILVWRGVVLPFTLYLQDAFMNTFDSTPAGAKLTDLTMVRDRARMGVDDLEARYLEALAGGFMTWTAGLGMMLQ